MSFICIIAIVMTGYGVASRSMVYYPHPDIFSTGNVTTAFEGRPIFRQIIYPAYYLIFGEVSAERENLDRKFQTISIFRIDGNLSTDVHLWNRVSWCWLVDCNTCSPCISHALCQHSSYQSTHCHVQVTRTILLILNSQHIHDFSKYPANGLIESMKKHKEFGTLNSTRSLVITSIDHPLSHRSAGFLIFTT